MLIRKLLPMSMPCHRCSQKTSNQQHMAHTHDPESRIPACSCLPQWHKRARACIHRVLRPKSCPQGTPGRSRSSKARTLRLRTQRSQRCRQALNDQLRIHSKPRCRRPRSGQLRTPRTKCCPVPHTCQRGTASTWRYQHCPCKSLHRTWCTCRRQRPRSILRCMALLSHCRRTSGPPGT